MNLKRGSIIGITCPAGYVAAERVQYAVTVLESWGYRVRLGRTVGSEFHYFSGTDEERLADLQEMLDDTGIDAILMGRGGYGMSRIIDRLDFRAFKARPKWICGFSDITVLLNHIYATLDVPSLHSPMCGAFKPATEFSEHILSLKNALEGKGQEYRMPASALNRAGKAEGILIGGNLSLFVHLLGSPSEPDTRGMILFIEDIGEHLYHIDRMLVQLKRAGKLDGLAALLVGSFTDMKDTERPFGQSLEEIIADKVKEYGYPVCFNMPCGHQDINFALTIGARHTLFVGDSGSRLVR